MNLPVVIRSGSTFILEIITVLFLMGVCCSFALGWWDNLIGGLRFK